MSQTVLSFERLEVGYDGRPVVRDITFSVLRGELLALLGPNGAGKTTVLKTVAGLIRPLAGRIRFAEESLRRQIGYVPQHDRLDPIFPLSVWEVVMMGTYARRRFAFRTTAADRTHVERCLDRVGATDLAARRFAELSGGQKQRVLIARALAADPEIVLLDEPTSGVDPGAESIIMQLLRDLSTVNGLTVLLVSHHLGVIRGIVDSVVWVSGGSAVKGASAEMLTSDRIESAFGALEAIND